MFAAGGSHRRGMDDLCERKDCGKRRGEHAAITSGIVDEHYCPPIKGESTYRGFSERRYFLPEYR